MLLAPPALHPVDDKLRVLALHVKAASGDELALHVPWDRSAFDLEPALVAGTPFDHPDRFVVAFCRGPDGTVDLLEVPLGKALRHAENSEGSDHVILQIEAPDGAVTEFTITCAGLTEPEAHLPYPRPVDEATERLLGAYLASEEPEWFCDGSSTLSCCTAHREAPNQLTWVTL